MPTRYWHTAHLELPEELAPIVRALMADGLRRARRDGLVSNARLLEWLGELDRMAVRRIEAVRRPDLSPSPPQVWIGTTEAAAVIGIGERSMRNYVGRGVTSRKVGNKRLWLEADVHAEADARADCGSVRNAPATGNRAD